MPGPMDSQPAAPGQAPGSAQVSGSGQVSGSAQVSGSGQPGDPGEPTDPGRRFEDLVADLLGEPGVTPPRGGSGFGRSALRWDGKIFAMYVRGRLVLKLPEQRVDDLLEEGEGDRFDANKGTPMREWVSLNPASARPWLPLAREALDFARTARAR